MSESAYHLTSNGPRVNTLVIDLTNLPARKVNMDLIAKFIHEKLKIPFSDIRSLQHNTGKSLVFVECRTEEQAIAITEKNDGGYVIVVDKVNYKLNVYMEDGATTVRVHDVSPRSENSCIKEQLEKYGEVVWIKEEVWVEPAILKGIVNGIRSVRIKLHTAIPSYINVNGQVTLVTYKHQQQTCRHCNKPVHWGRKCIEASYLEMQVNGGSISDRLRASGVDYAGALKAPGAGSGKSVQGRNTDRDADEAGVGLNYVNLGNLFTKPSNQGQGKSSISTNNTNKNTEQTHKTTNTYVAGHSKTSEVNKGSSADIGIPLSNTYGDMISDDDMDTDNTETNPEGYQSPSRKKRNLSKNSST